MSSDLEKELFDLIDARKAFAPALRDAAARALEKGDDELALKILAELLALEKGESRARSSLQFRAEPRRFRLRRFFLGPAFAYLLALLLIYPAYLGLKWLGEDRPAASTLQIIELQQAERTAGPSLQVKLEPGARSFALSFFIPIEPGLERRYELALFDASGRLVASVKGVRSWDGLGNFLLLCDTNQFPPGNYRLVVKEEEKEGPGRAEFTFPFSLR